MSPDPNSAANAAARPDQSPRQTGRPPEIEDLSNRLLIHPLSAIVEARALKSGISANALSVSGLLCGVIAAIAFYGAPQPVNVAVGFLAMVSWHVFDGADGRVARATGTASPAGRVLDGLCDHAVFTLVYLALIMNMISAGWSPVTAIFLAVGAGISHAVQAAGYEERRQKYERRLSGRGLSETRDPAVHEVGSGSLLTRAYDFAQGLFLGPRSGLEGALADLRSEKNGPRYADATKLVRQTSVLVRMWSVLNANNRTILIAVTALGNLPAAYFFVELTAFNAIFVFLIYYEWAYEKSLVRNVEVDAVIFAKTSGLRF